MYIYHHIYVHIYTYIYIYTSTYTNIYTYIYIYIHKHMYIATAPRADNQTAAVAAGQLDQSAQNITRALCKHRCGCCG